MNRQRMKELKRVLETVIEEDRPFSMAYWASGVPHPITTPVADCGTASCAAGWAARDPWFNEQGLTLVLHGQGRYIPRYQGVLSYTALGYFFDIGGAGAHRLFDPWEYEAARAGNSARITPEMVLCKVNAMLDEDERRTNALKEELS